MGLSGLSATNFLFRCMTIKQAVSDNAAVFVNPNPTLVLLGVALDQLTVRQTAVENIGGKDNTTLRNVAWADLFDLMRTLAIYVEGVADGDPEIILLSGFELVAQRTTDNDTRPAPDKILVKADGLNLGELLVSWAGVSPNQGYAVNIYIQNPDGTHSKDVSVKPKRLKHLFTGLQSGERYSIRVATLNSVGTGPWSNVLYHRPQ